MLQKVLLRKYYQCNFIFLSFNTRVVSQQVIEMFSKMFSSIDFQVLCKLPRTVQAPHFTVLKYVAKLRLRMTSNIVQQEQCCPLDNTASEYWIGKA